MNANYACKSFMKNALGAVISGLLLINAHGAPTVLGTEPFTSTSGVHALPNVMFLLDDSGSMDFDYLPDWAGPYRDASNLVATPPHRFFNSAYNGVAYNPATRYRPPVMFTNTGALDTTTYPSQTGQSVAQGGNAVASTSTPNWRAVKKDAYGIQSTDLVNLEGSAFFYTTVAGEYCTSSQLRSCTAASAPSGSYTFPAKLRWCTTSLKAVDTTANAAGYCQGSNIANTPTNITNGVTLYTYPRIPGPRTSTITVTAGGSVSGITVNALQIMSASAVVTNADASGIATQINACTYGIPTGSNCTVVGYSATSLGGMVTVTAPGAVSFTPVVSGATVTASAFSGGTVPGEALLTVITPSVTSYPFPGGTIKSPNRTDCAASACTYAEEMTNYANWYTYYRTRMQMMKSASSIAFSSVDDQYRVGYYSINNGSGSDFLNPSAFDGAQKNLWYSKVLGARAFGPTPLRNGLANIGRMYAGKVSTLNGQTVSDPIQYSCQQNFTILSTDGYWNDADTPKQIDGSTQIGEQDGNDPRPYYDGATQTKTISQTTMAQQQTGLYAFLVESRTQHQQTTRRRLTESVVTTTTYPWTEQTTTLQTRTTPLNQSAYKLESRTYPLTSTTRQLEERTYQIQQTTYPLERYTYNLTKTTTPLQAKVYNIKSVTTPLQQKTYNITSVTTPLQAKVYNIKSVTTPLQQKTYNITSVTTPLQAKVYNIISSTYDLQKSTYQLQSTTYQLQKRSQVSSNGGDTWVDTGWVNASSCTVLASGPGYVRNTTCQYIVSSTATNLNSCTNVAASVSPNYTVANPVTCSYQTTPTVTTETSCTPVAQSGSSPYTASATCAYSATPTVLTGQTSCTAVAQSAGTTKTGPARTCVFETTPTSTTVVTSCTAVTPANAATPQTTCGYTGTAVTLTGQTTCTAVAQSTANTYTGPARTCTHESTVASTTDVTSCTSATPSPAATPKITCGYTGTAVTLTGQTSCTAAAQSGSSPYAGPARTCTFETTPVSTTVVTSCTAVTPANAATPQTTCTYDGTTTTLTGQTTCTPVAQSSANTYTGPARTCTHEGTVATTTDVTSCTSATPSPATTPKITCGYTGTAVTLTGQTACTAVAQSGSSPYAGPARTCTFETTPVSTTVVTSCTAATPANAATPKTTCTYDGTPSTLTNQTTCTPVAQSTANTYTGPAVACAWQAATVTSGLSTCSPTGSNAGPPYNSYTTCGYGTGVVTANLNSCTADPAETGPSYSNGSYTACAYQGTYAAVNVTSCTPVAQSGTFAAPQKTCVYASGTTAASGLSSCANVAQSTSAPYVGPAVTCAYATTASASNLNATTCTANRQSASPFTGPAVDCTYNATATVTSNVSSCTNVAQSAGPSYTGPAIACAYGATSGWSTAGSTCTAVAQSTGPSYVGPARDCQYSASTDALVGTCTEIPQSTGPSYTQLVAKHCVAGSFPVVSAAVVNTVDSCSTAPTSSGSPIVVSTATTCAYQAAVTVDSATCTPAAASVSSPYTTEVSCPVSDTGYVAVVPTCSAAGTSPATFDGTGKLVECRTTDVTGSAASPTPVASCTPSTDALTKVQTTCPSMLNTTPVPVASCSPTVGLPSGPDYVRTICNSTSAAATVMGCSPQTASSPLWQTVTCVDDGSGTQNTLADVAAYYYKTDLRTTDLNNCVGAIVPPATVGATLCSSTDPMNNVRTSSADQATWQHMTTFTLGLGVSGYMKYSDTYSSDTVGDFATVKGVSPFGAANGITADPANGVCSWQSSGNCNWPYPASDEQTAIDDLWHAGVNGRGAYFSATDPVSMSNSLSTALAGVAAAGGGAAAVAISTPNLVSGDNYVFSSTYTSLDWTGELVRQQIDPYTAAVLPGNDWSAQGKLDAKAYATRNIYTFDASVPTTKLKDFTSANFGTNSKFLSPNISTSPSGLTQFLCASADICLSATDQDSSHAAGANLVNFLRGDRSNEGAETDNTKYYRQRQHVLGDMVNAQVVYVTKPKYNYADPGYTAFITAQTARQAMVYAGANDGMLHAFAAKGVAATEALVDAAATAKANAYLDPGNAAAAATAVTAIAAASAAIGADTTIGQEQWAYIPSMLMSNLYRLADKKYKDKHRYFVDATPVVGDICVSDCNVASAVWKTILVGGLGRGGRGYYALDITNPASPKALWEFTDANLGYTYGNPQISKLSDGTWVVLFSSGYNNIPNDDGIGGDGVGRLYVLNAATGVQISGLSPISTGVGSVTDPSGLSKITAMVINPSSDNTIDAVYGGDLSGNLWRFDVNNTIGASGYDAQLLAKLKDGSGTTQPITAKPEVGIIQNQNVVFIGTGRFLASDDATDTSQQTLYAIKDPRTPLTSPATAIFDNPGGAPRVTGTSTQGFVRQIETEGLCPAGTSTSICAQGSTVRTSTNNSVNFLSDNGWFVDFIGVGERANTSPALALGMLALDTNQPSLLACDLGGKSYSYFLDYLTGGAIYGPGNDGGVASMFLANAFAADVSIAVTATGTPILIHSTPGANITKPPPTNLTYPTRRTSWRELIRGD